MNFRVEGFDFFEENANVSLLTITLLGLFLRFAPSAYAFVDVPLKKLVPIVVSISTGNVQIEGWSQDRVRVVVEPKIPVSDNVDSWVRIEEIKEGVLIRLDPWSKLTMPERIRAQTSGDKTADVKIYVPWASFVDLNALKGDVKLATFRGEGIIRAKGRVIVGDLRSRHRGVTLIADAGVMVGQGSGKISIRSSAGAVDLGRLSQAELTIQSKESKINILGAMDSSLTIESLSGSVVVENSSGKLFVQSGGADVSVLRFKGNLDVESESGKVLIKGFVGKGPDSSVRNRSGYIQFEPPIPRNLAQIQAKGCQVRAMNREGWTLGPRVSSAPEWAPCVDVVCARSSSSNLRFRCGI